MTRHGLEGGAIYALSADIREAIARDGHARLWIDLRPDARVEELAAKLAQQPANQSAANRLRKALHMTPLETNLLREAHGKDLPADPAAMATAIKGAPLTLTAIRPIARAISTAGGVAFGAVDLLPGMRPYVLAMSAASLLYIAMSDLIPDLHRGDIDSNAARQVVLIALGIATIVIVERLIG